MTDIARLSWRGWAVRLSYAALFVGALPLALAVWAVQLDRTLGLPGIRSVGVGIAVAAGGIALALAATTSLWRVGGGLPASPFPPERLVSSGVYRWIAHPIYAGAVAVALGVSLAAGSGAGLWIITPVLACAAVAWVLGFERAHTARRFGRTASPLLALPGDDDAPLTAWHRAAVYARVLLPWLVIYGAIELLGAPPDARSTYMAWEVRIPVLPWTEAVYALTYVMVLGVPLALARERELRRFALDGLTSMAIVFPAYLLLPLVAEARPIPGDGFWQSVMRLERTIDSPATAFPAYHVVWTLIAARAYAARWAWSRVPMLAVATAVGVSCMTTGLHAFADVVAGVVAFAVVTRRGAVWNGIRTWTERLANSWAEARVGPVRFVSHGVYAGLGAALGVGAAGALAGADQLPWLLAMTAAAITGAALWAQVVEGSQQLLRPFGYFGAVIGVAVIVIVAAPVGADAWTLTAAFGIGCSITYAAGRLRCLVQGCCHGAPAPEHLGIVYSHPRSRVVRLSPFGGLPIHATPLYSAVWMLAIGACMLRLWMIGAPLSFIVGSYFILTGLGRFVEEHYRGEPQTPTAGGLRLYQWLAIAFIIGGAIITALPAPRAPATAGLPLVSLPLLLLVALGAFAAYGLDFPASTRRFSRLT